jgi:stage III sporulation protein AD
VVVLSVDACCMVACIAMQYWAEAINFIWKLNNTVLRGSMFLETLLRIVGVSLLTELTCLISADAGNTSLGKAMQILGNAVNLVLSLPVFENFFTTIQEILRIT